MSSHDDDKLITASEAADLLAIERQVLYAAARRGAVPAVRPTGTRAIRFRRGDIVAIVRGLRPPAKAEG